MEAGISYNLISDQESFSIIEKQTENVIETSPFENDVEMKNKQYGLFAGAGIDKPFLKRMYLGIEIMAQLGGQVHYSHNNFYNIESKTKSIYTSLYIRF